jgi:hypothetical protein
MATSSRVTADSTAGVCWMTIDVEVINSELTVAENLNDICSLLSSGCLQRCSQYLAYYLFPEPIDELLSECL